MRNEAAFQNSLKTICTAFQQFRRIARFIFALTAIYDSNVLTFIFAFNTFTFSFFSFSELFLLFFFISICPTLCWREWPAHEKCEVSQSLHALTKFHSLFTSTIAVLALRTSYAPSTCITSSKVEYLVCFRIISFTSKVYEKMLSSSHIKWVVTAMK